MSLDVQIPPACRAALEGLALGDAFGQQFFHSIPEWLARRQPPPPKWSWTDDTAMALSIVEVLANHGRVDQDALAEAFARRYAAEPDRGYGPGMHRLLPSLADGVHWSTAAEKLFRGQGSFGNGGAMRVAPLGAYFADDLPTAAEQGALSAEVTHCHVEGIAGTIAVAVATAVAAANPGLASPRVRGELLDAAIEHTAAGPTRAGLETARQLPRHTEVTDAARVLGNGSDITSQGTVPLALWCAARHLDSYEEALWSVVAAGGDIDTVGAIVGGIVASSVGLDGLPAEWLKQREALPRGFAS